MSDNFQSVNQVEVKGIGLHSGQDVNVRLLPGKSVGILFRRVDLPGQPYIEADWRHISQTVHATTLQQDNVRIATPEHLLAALWMMGVTHCEVELDGPEVPILDGSSAPWCDLIEGNLLTVCAGETRPIFGLREPVFFQDGDASVLALPHHELRVSVAVDFACDYLPMQNFDSIMTSQSFQAEVAQARTFALEAWIEPLKALGLIRGGSVENAILLQKDAPSTPLRFSNELARHKAIDLLGDLALMFAPQGAALQAHLVAIRAGHSVHARWMQICAEQNTLVPVAAIPG